MFDHKFRVGQAVNFSPARGVDHRSKGRYTIIRLLPVEGNTPQYRIKNSVDGHERMVQENELGSQ
jgi:hypothetical protein